MRRSNASLFRQMPPPPPGHVWVEWVGETSPLDNPEVQYGLITDRYTADQREVIRRLCQQRIARVHKHSRTLTRGNGARDIAGLSQDWTFGNDQRRPPGHPQSYAKALPFRDADAIKSSVVGHEFIIHDERDGEAVDLIKGTTDHEVVLVKAGAFANMGSFRREMGWR